MQGSHKRRIVPLVLISLPPALAVGYWVQSYAGRVEHRSFCPTGRSHTYVFLASDAGRVSVKFSPGWPTKPGTNEEAEWATCRAFESRDRLFSRQSSGRGVAGFQCLFGE